MDDEFFAQQVLAWLDPAQFRQCEERLRTAPEAAAAKQKLIIGSGYLKRADEAAFDQLLGKFLRGFRIREELIDSINAAAPQLAVSDATRNFLVNLRITPTVEIVNGAAAGKPSRYKVLLYINERDFVLDVIRDPVLGLLDFVTRMAHTWKPLRWKRMSVYYEPTVPGPFFGYVESHVAAAYVKMSLPPHIKGQSGAKWRYRAITTFGDLSADAPDWEITRRSARQAALSTMLPV